MRDMSDGESAGVNMPAFPSPIRAENGHAPADEDDDAPLDFSMKRGGESEGDGGAYTNNHAGEEEEDERQHNGLNGAPPSPLPGALRVDVKQEPVEEQASPGAVPPVSAAMPALLPALTAPGVLGNGGVLGSFPFMMDPRVNGGQQVAAGNKASRPFKAYPKDPLSIPLGGYYGLTGVLPFSLDPAAAKAMGVSPEELLAQYQRLYATGAGAGGVEESSPHAVNIPGPAMPPLPTTDKTTPSTSPPGLSPSPASSLSPVSPVRLGTPIRPPAPRPSIHARKRPRSLPDDQKDEAYWERRRKNNEAAKRSRDARRAKEDEIAIRAAFLEQENLKLRVEVAALKNETAKLRCMLYNS